MSVHAFSKVISLKVKIIAHLEFELAFYDVTVWHKVLSMRHPVRITSAMVY